MKNYIDRKLQHQFDDFRIWHVFDLYKTFGTKLFGKDLHSKRKLENRSLRGPDRLEIEKCWRKLVAYIASGIGIGSVI